MNIPNSMMQKNKYYMVGAFLFILLAFTATAIRGNIADKRVQKAAQEKSTAGENLSEANQYVKLLQEQVRKPSTGSGTNGSSFGGSISGKSDRDKLQEFFNGSANKKKLLFFHSGWNRDSVMMLEDLRALGEKVGVAYAVAILEVEGSSEGARMTGGPLQAEWIKLQDSSISAEYVVDAVPSLVLLDEGVGSLGTYRGRILKNELLELLNLR